MNQKMTLRKASLMVRLRSHLVAIESIRLFLHGALNGSLVAKKFGLRDGADDVIVKGELGGSLEGSLDG